MNNQYKEELVELLRTAAKDAKLFEAVLRDILTPSEYREIANRWQIVKKLAMGEDQRAIAQDLKVGITTVTRGVHVLENSGGGFNQMLSKLVARK